MPVPRCESCAHWTERLDVRLASGGRAGECTARNGPWSDCNDYTILTSSGFGCVMHEAKSA
jgi:hypothetical protein